MLFIFAFVVESFTALRTGKSIHSRMFRFMILLSLNRFKNFTTIFTRIPFTFVTPHVHLKIITIIVPLSANATEMRVVSSVVLSVHIESIFSIKCFVALIASPHFHFCTQALLLLKFVQLFGFLLSELNM